MMCTELPLHGTPAFSLKSPLSRASVRLVIHIVTSVKSELMQFQDLFCIIGYVTHDFKDLLDTAYVT
jgi:hypothetical protein